jgi:hypothetical protein
MKDSADLASVPKQRSGWLMLYVLALATMIGAWVILASMRDFGSLVVIPLPTNGRVLDSTGKGIAGARIVEYQVLQDGVEIVSCTGELVEPTVYVDCSGKLSVKLGTVAIADSEGNFELERPLRPKSVRFEYFAEAEGFNPALILEERGCDFYVIGEVLVEPDPDEGLVLIHLSRW